MSELQERDPVSTAPEPVVGDEEDDRPTFLVIAQFFLIPLVVITVCVGLFFTFGLMTGKPDEPSQYLAEIRSGSKARRYQAAYELSKLLMYDQEAAREPAFVRELARIFAESAGGEPELRRYLALALAQVADRSTLDALLTGLSDPDAQTRIYTIWAIGTVGDPAAVPSLVGLLSDGDAGVRKTAAFTLGALGDGSAAPALREALGDPTADVQWNAALALARLGDPSGTTVLRRMLDRDYLKQVPGVTPEQASEAMMNAIRALAMLGDRESLPNLDRLGAEDPDLEVRSVAMQGAEAIRNGPGPEPPGS